MTSFAEIFGEEKKLNSAQQRARTQMETLQQSILSGEHTEGDPIIDFCIVSYGLNAKKYEAKVRKLDETLRENSEVLLINSRRYSFGSNRGCAPAPRHTEEFRRFGIMQGAPDWKQNMKEGVVLPMQQYAWSLTLDIVMQPLKVHTTPIIISPEEISEGKLYGLFQEHLPWEIKKHGSGWGLEGHQKFEVLAGKEMIKKMKFYDDMFEFDVEMGHGWAKGHPGFSKEAHLIANEGLSYKDFRTLQRKDAKEYQQNALLALWDSVYLKMSVPNRILYLRNAIAAGLDKADISLEHDSGVTVNSRNFVGKQQEIYRQQLE